MLVAEKTIPNVINNNCLTNLKEDFLDPVKKALGNLKLYNKSDCEVLVHKVYDCCQFIWYDFNKSINGQLVLDKSYYGGENYYYKDTYLEMYIELNEFINPLEAKYSKIEYIEKYVSLLQKMGSPWIIKSITDTHVYIQMDYNEIEPDEKCWLILHWQAIRNLIINYNLHVPARFIELVELFESKFDLFFLYQVANLMIPVKCIISYIGVHRFNNYNSFINYYHSVFDNDSHITISKINRTINVLNLRSKLKNKDNCKKFFNKDNRYEIMLKVLEYDEMYHTLTKPQSKEDLYLKLRLLKANKLHKNE
jgi:hypothetical protein